jgi:hypothetical protein
MYDLLDPAILRDFWITFQHPRKGDDSIEKRKRLLVGEAASEEISLRVAAVLHARGDRKP